MIKRVRQVWVCVFVFFQVVAGFVAPLHQSLPLGLKHARLDSKPCLPAPPHPARLHRDFRPAWPLNRTAWEAAAGNYYPLTAAMAIQDSERQLALLTERAQGELAAGWRMARRQWRAIFILMAGLGCLLLNQPAPLYPRGRAGGASLRSGEMEVMVHRRTLAGPCTAAPASPATPLAHLAGLLRALWHVQDQCMQQRFRHEAGRRVLPDPPPLDPPPLDPPPHHPDPALPQTMPGEWRSR